MNEFTNKIKKVIVNNAYLKVIALVLGVLLWVYIVYETSGSEGLLGYSLPRIFQAGALHAKYIPVRATIVGLPTRGYHINKEKIRIYPNTVLAVGPSRNIEMTEYLRTAPIEVTGRKETFKMEVPLEKATFKREDLIEVIVPIEKD